MPAHTHQVIGSLVVALLIVVAAITWSWPSSDPTSAAEQEAVEERLEQREERLEERQERLEERREER
jgi:hypothetical protein